MQSWENSQEISDINAVAIENESAILSLLPHPIHFSNSCKHHFFREKIYDYHLYRTKKGLGNALGLCKWLEYS